MRLPQIKMESQQARISIQQRPSQMEIRQPKADMQLRQPKADLQIKTTKGQLNIDQSKAFAEANLKSPLRWNEEYAKKGKQGANTGTARRARQGNQLIDIHHGGNAIASQAMQNGHPADKMLGLKYIPSPLSVKINYKPGNVNIQAQENKPQLQVQKRDPEIGTHRGQVMIGMAQEAYLRMHVEQE